MLRKIITKSDAAHEWVREFNAIDSGIIAKLMSIDIDDWQEVTTPRVCDRVYCFDSETYGEVVDIDNNDYTIKLDDGTEITLSISELADLEDDLKDLDEDYNTDCEDVSEIECERIWIESYKDDHNSLINDIAEIKENIAELEEELKEV